MTRQRQQRRHGHATDQARVLPAAGSCSSSPVWKPARARRPTFALGNFSLLVVSASNILCSCSSSRSATIHWSAPEAARAPHPTSEQSARARNAPSSPPRPPRRRARQGQRRRQPAFADVSRSRALPSWNAHVYKAVCKMRSDGKAACVHGDVRKLACREGRRINVTPRN